MIGRVCTEEQRGGGAVKEQAEISTPGDAANDALVLAFGRLQGAANRLEYILGRALEAECGISHLTFECCSFSGGRGSPGCRWGPSPRSRS